MTIAVFPPAGVASGVPLAIAQGGTGATTAATARTALGLGTLAEQNANAVAITGGAAVLSALSGTAIAGLYGLQVGDRAGNDVIAVNSAINASGGTNRWGIIHYGNAPSLLGGSLQVDGLVGVGQAPTGSGKIALLYSRSTNGILIRPDADTGGATVLFQNAASATVGSITTTASATAFNTASDVRLKHAIVTLAGALSRVQALRPVAFRWNADDSAGQGFLAHELQQVVPEAVSGLPDEVNDDGSIRAQQVDHSKLVPWLTAALQATLAQVEALTARVAKLAGGTA